MLRAVLDDYVARLAEKPEVAGVVILGGLARTGSRRFVDRTSDLDVSCFLSLPVPPELLRLHIRDFLVHVQPYLPSWVPNFKFLVPGSFSGLDWDVPLNNHQHVLEYEIQEHVQWDWHALEMYANGSEVVYDPTGDVAKLIAQKLETGRIEQREAVIRLLAFGRVLAKDTAGQCVARGHHAVAHDVLNEVLREVTTAWYALSDRFAPFVKWRIANLPSLDWAPPDAADRYAEAVRVSANDAAEVRRRQGIILAFIDEIETRCRATDPDWPQDIYSYAVNRVFWNRQLRARTVADMLPEVVGLHQDDKMRVERWDEFNWLLRSEKDLRS
ncbi:hypothetical protein MF672_001050 [Actinomadura sp. ATCC 31491]|uniref:Nucleotidyltransferase domain-containing protein n=1 Tax=Actinomadura luzonensis TaxID=2805427 RepID=A0ABT0FJ97_9ACTN|nr:hypothetical protein [Actinomadura luzonensis]MCK2212393.1 hypothetical protein [Actinomadura luzonensis]